MHHRKRAENAVGGGRGQGGAYILEVVEGRDGVMMLFKQEIDQAARDSCGRLCLLTDTEQASQPVEGQPQF